MGSIIRFPRVVAAPEGQYPARPFFLRLQASNDASWETMPQFLRAVMDLSERFGATKDGAQDQGARAAGAFVVGDEGVFLGAALDGRKLIGHVYAYFENLDGFRTGTVYQLEVDHAPPQVWREGIAAIRAWADAGALERVTWYAHNRDGRGLARARRLRHIFGTDRPATIRSYWMEAPWPANPAHPVFGGSGVTPPSR